MRFHPSPHEPVGRPTLSDARVLGDVALDYQTQVGVGGIVFTFRRVPGTEDWTGGDATTGLRGHALDAPWLEAARNVAIEALKREIVDRGLGLEEPSDTVRCADCGRLLCSTEFVDAGRHTAVECGPIHAVAYPDGRALIFRPDGSTSWCVAEETR